MSMRTDRRMWYKLKGKKPVPCDVEDSFADDRRVAETTIGESYISTVFLGLDHQFGDGPPLLFETMVFGGPLADETDRYSTWEEAEAGHNAMVAKVSAEPPKH